MQTVILLTLLIIFISTLTRSTFGFGDALIAMPLLTLTIGVKTATPLVAFVATTIAVTIVWRSWRAIDIKATWKLVLSSLVGIPIGLLVLKTAPETIVKSILGLALIGFGLYNLVQPQLITLYRQNWVYVFGFVAGILGGAYNTNGPPVIIYGTFTRWPPDKFRASLQGYFLPTGLLIIIGHGLGGLWTPHVLQLYVLALPLVLLAIFLGGKLNQRIPPGRFEKLIYAVLIVLGVLLLL